MVITSSRRVLRSVSRGIGVVALGSVDHRYECVMGIMEVPKDPVLGSVLIFVVYDINAITHRTGLRAPPLVLSSIAQVGERHSKRRAGLGRL